MTETKETLEALDSISAPEHDQSVEMRDAGPEAATATPQLVVVHNLTSLDGSTLVNNGATGVPTPGKATRYRQRYRREWEDIPQFKGEWRLEHSSRALAAQPAVNKAPDTPALAPLS